MLQSTLTFIRDTNWNKSTFSTGYVFNYWPKRPRWIREDLDVSPRHESLKEEILASQLVTLEQWEKKCIFKAKKCVTAEAVREITAQHARAGTFARQNTKGDYMKEDN